MNRFKYLAMAALVAFAACDEGEETVTTPPVTGSITGVVTIDGTGASGVTVTLSSGATATTDGAGSYSFSGVDAGAYTVTISGFAADATFSSTSQAATISTAGQVVNVNFSGAYVRTSAILGAVAAGGMGLENVNVSIGAQSTTTDANGQYSFSGLRAGDYTVTISGFDASLYVFPSTSQSVTVAVGESQVVSFSGTLQATAKIGGYLYLDELPKNDFFDTSEEALPIAGVTITLEGPDIGSAIQTLETDAGGEYWFTDLVPGTYRVSIDAADDDIPETIALGLDDNSRNIAVTTGATGAANWPFDIVKQTVTAYAFYGLDEVNPGIAPVEGIILDLYPTESDFTSKTNRLARDTTDANGEVQFTFDREDDTGPQPNTIDNIVFVERILPLPANHVLSGETFFEFEYNPTQLMGTAPDTFDVVSTAATIRVKGEDGLGNPLEDWTTRWWKNDTTAASFAVGVLDTAGVEERTVVGAAGKYLAGGVDTFFVRLNGVQTENNGHGWKQMAVAGPFGAVANVRTLMATYDGFGNPTIVRRVGTEVVSYTDMDIVVRVHREADDVMGYSAGDNFANVNSTQIDIYNIDEDGDTAIVSGATWSPQIPAAGSGWATFGNVPVGSTFFLETTSNNAAIDVLDMADMDITAYLTGLTQVDTIKTLEGDEGISTFMIKHNNTWLRGKVLGTDGVTGAPDLDVTIMPTADNIQSNLVDTTLVTGAAGAYKLEGLREGPYMIQVAGDDSWDFFEVLETTSTPVSSGSEDNDDETSGERDNEGNNVVSTTNFMAERIDTEIEGQVVNDRDGDGNVIDPFEALAGATMELYSIIDDDTTMVSSTDTDADGYYSFTGLREGDYLVMWMAGTPNTDQDVLRALGVSHVDVTTSPAAPVVGDLTDDLPAWNYDLTEGTDLGDSDFAFLYKNTTINGTVEDGAGDPVAGMQIAMRRCDDSTGSGSPPVAVSGAAFCSTYLGTTVLVATDTNGDFTFTGLTEGVYQITPQPGTVGGYTTSTPAAMLYLTVGNGDVETATAAFVAS